MGIKRKISISFIFCTFEKCDSPNSVMQDKQDGFPRPAGRDNYMNAENLTQLLSKLL